MYEFLWLQLGLPFAILLFIAVLGLWGAIRVRRDILRLAKGKKDEEAEE